jgi:Rrf2 family protein
MMELALQQEEAPVRLKDIANAQGISIKYLENLFRELKKAKLVLSVVGKNGGYRLARNPADIELLDIIEAMEGDIAPVECVTNVNYCKKVDECMTHCVWSKVDEAVRNILRNITVQDLVGECLKRKKNNPPG